VGQLLLHRHAVVLPAVADLDPADRARGVHAARAEQLAQVAIWEARPEAAFFEGVEQFGLLARPHPGRDQVTQSDHLPRPFGLGSLYVPWATRPPGASPAALEATPSDPGGEARLACGAGGLRASVPCR